MKIGESKVSQRGSVVIPKAVRIALTVKDGDSLEWHFEIDKVVVSKKVAVDMAKAKKVK